MVTISQERTIYNVNNINSNCLQVCLSAELKTERFISELLVVNHTTMAREVRLTGRTLKSSSKVFFHFTLINHYNTMTNDAILGAAAQLIVQAILCFTHFMVNPCAMTATTLLNTLLSTCLWRKASAAVLLHCAWKMAPFIVSDQRTLSSPLEDMAALTSPAHRPIPVPETEMRWSPELDFLFKIKSSFSSTQLVI